MIRPSLQYNICGLYRWDEYPHTHFYRWGSWGSGLSCLSPESLPTVLENEPCLSVSWSTAQSIKLLLPTEGELCAAAVAHHAESICADLLCFILLALTFLSDFRCFFFCCTARHFPTLRALYFPFLFLPPPSFSYVSNYLDSILIYKMCCQYHSGALKTLPEQRCPLV